jgi:adenine-specific DNA-methyltransferase
VKLEKVKTPKGDPARWWVTLLGLDTDYDPTWCFRVCQAFFPRTGPWDNLRKELRAQYDDTLWDQLAGTTSAPFEAGEQCQVAVKVIDERGNELLVVKALN